MAEEIKSGTHSPARKSQPPLWKEVDGMTEKEQMTMLIENYTDLQRIKSAVDKDKEIDYQIKTVKAKLSALGITTEDLDIH
ncbi:hypothetical protein D3Z52_12875 [Clostridiaceae bacterium]|nr:hypothetical protein [Clostridiaceae bacterium]